MKDYQFNEDGISIKGCSYIYAPAGQAGEYAPLASNPYRGCGHKCVYCVSGDTLVTMADGGTKPIRDTNEGDSILGIAIDGSGRMFDRPIIPTTVLAKVATKRRAYKITLEGSTEVVCSYDHRWLTIDGWKSIMTDTDDPRPFLAVGDYIYKPHKSAIYAQSTVGDVVRVINIQPLGKSIVMYDITTGTETFIANGLVSHNCYVPKILKMERKVFDAGAIERENFISYLTKDARKYQAMGSTAQVMLSFTTDPYHPGDTRLTRRTIEILQAHGLGVCTLTKGGSRALRDMHLFRPDRDAFASTLTSLDDTFSKKWEGGAALPEDRIDTLRQFHENGIFTWVSLEPTLDTASSLAIVERTHHFVDLFKIGRANYLPMTSTTDWQDYTLRMIDLCQRLGVKHYIKKDLQGFLPDGYYNPRRVDQFHGAAPVAKPAIKGEQISLF